MHSYVDCHSLRTKNDSQGGYFIFDFALLIMLGFHDPSYLEIEIRTGRKLAIIGSVLGWSLLLLLALLLFIRFQKQKLILCLIAIVALSLSVLSMFLFMGLNTESCQGLCEPNVVLAAIPASILFLTTTVAIVALQQSHCLSSPGESCRYGSLVYTLLALPLKLLAHSHSKILIIVQWYMVV
jgi:hypothetical protein